VNEPLAPHLSPDGRQQAGLTEQLRDGAAGLGLALSDAQELAFLRYLELLRRWNRRARLTALTADEAVIHLHFLDSLTILRAHLPPHARVVDVGSGAGFPGIPLAIAREDLRVALLEPAARKAAFLELVAVELKLPIVVRQERAEVAGQDPQWREHFDVATARAVARTRILAELLLPLVKVGGRAVLLKGPSAEAEVTDVRQAAAVLGGELSDVISVTLPRGERRILMVVAKVASTPDMFPRRTVLHTRRALT
jgi:16S rRNA (guanine527-N7)-methyltransferase